MKQATPFPQTSIGTLAAPEPGSFKIGPFGSSLKSDELVADGIPVLGIENVHPNRLVAAFRRFITPQKFEQLSQYLVLDGDVLVTTMGTIGRAAVVPQGLGTAIIDSHLFRMRVDQSKVFPRYLCYAINDASLYRQLERKATGSIMSGLNTTILRECTIALPSLAEQHSIVAVLDEQLAAVERARAAAERQLAAARALPSAYLRAVFDSDEARAWPSRPFGTLVDNFDGRRVPVKLDDRRARRGAYPYYGASGVIDSIDDYLFDGEYLLIGEDGANLVMRSSPVAFRATGKFWVNNHAHVVQPRHEVAFDYLLHFIAITDLKPFVSGAAQPKLTQDDLNSIPVAVPPLAHQTKLMALVNEQIELANGCAENARQELEAVSSLPETLLRVAFNGGL